jgi:hypothetical protein
MSGLLVGLLAALLVAALTRISPRPANDLLRSRCVWCAEGVVVLRGRVDIERHGWSTPQDDLDRWLWAPARGPAPRRARRRRMIDAFGNRRGGRKCLIAM